MIHKGTPLSRRIYGAAAICLHLTLLVGCISIPTSSSPHVPGPQSTRITVQSLPVATASDELDRETVSTRISDTQLGNFPHSASMDDQLAWTFERGRILVEHETRTELGHVGLKIANESEIQQEVTRVTENLVFEQFDKLEYAEFFLKKIVGDQQGTYAALYVDREQQVLVSRSLLRAYIDSVEERSQVYPALLALLIHELVHAADDVTYGIHKNRVLSFKASFTQSAAFEGHAQFVTRNICREHNCLGGMDALETFMFETTQIADPVAQSVQAISRNVLEYSYIEGERFLTELSKRPNGQQLINRVLRQPPEDPVQILVPQTYPDIARESRNNSLFTALQPDNHIWSQYPWQLVETSPIKGIDVRNDPDRRVAAVEGFTELIVSMTGAQLYNQSEQEIAPVDIMLIEAENPSTARLFAESFVNRSANSIASDSGNDAINVNRYENQGAIRYSLYQVSAADQDWPEPMPSSVIGLVGQYVVQISASIAPKDKTLENYARKVISSVGSVKGRS